jgi:hypothetical protein
LFTIICQNGGVLGGNGVAYLEINKLPCLHEKKKSTVNFHTFKNILKMIKHLKETNHAKFCSICPFDLHNPAYYGRSRLEFNFQTPLFSHHTEY